MRILLTNPRGFCAGVRMAIDVVDRIVDLYSPPHPAPPTSPLSGASAAAPPRASARPISVYHEIVHNRHVVTRFKGRGVTFVDNLSDVPPAAPGKPAPIVVFSAHGVSPAIRREAESRGLTAIDATCPLVTKVHSEAIRYARQGYQILLIGHRDHQEVIGTTGEAPDAIQVVESPEDIPHLSIRDASRLVYLTQTTLSTDDAGVIIDALKRAFPEIKSPPSDDICYATTNRQHAVRVIAPECDLVLVVGSKNSSNSVRLTEIARNVGTPAYLLDDVSELREKWFGRKERGSETARQRDRGEEDEPPAAKLGRHAHAHSQEPTANSAPADLTVLLTAGASAPEDLVAGICRELLRRYGGTIEQVDVFDEDVEFALPVALRRLVRESGAELPAGISVSKPIVTADLYGAVPLTVSARK